MKLALDKYGINMPAFGKIGGILASELSDNDAALHAAIVAINEAIDRGEPEGIDIMENTFVILTFSFWFLMYLYFYFALNQVG